MPWEQGEIPMKLKRNDDGLVVVTEDDFPVYVDEDGKDVVINVPKLQKDLKSANAESMERRKQITALDNELAELQQKYRDLDIDKAKEALKMVENLKDKDIIDAGEVEKIKTSIKEGFEKKLTDQKTDYEKLLDSRVSELKNKDSQIRSLLIKGAFDSSKFLMEKTVLTPDIAYRYFGDFFEVREVHGQLRAVGKFNGEDIKSRTEDPGEIASTEEAIEFLIDKYPQKERILRGASPSGSGFFSPDTRASEQTKTLAETLYPTMKNR